MWNGKYITSDTIIEKIFRDTEYRNEVMIDDVIEWMGEVIELIGVNLHYITKATDGNSSLNHPDPLSVKDYRAVLPKDLHILKAVFDANGHRYMEAQGDLIMMTNNMAGQGKYKLQNNMIFVNKQETTIYLAYQALPTSTTGFPLIPDDIKYVLAVKNYIIAKLDTKLWRKGRISDKVYHQTKQESEWYIGAANSSLRMPSEDEMEAIKNVRLRLIPQINDWENFFENTGVVEQRKIGSYNEAGIFVNDSTNYGVNSFDGTI